VILPVDGLYEFQGASAETASGFVNSILVQATDRSPEAIGERARWIDGSRPFSAVEARSLRS
jgi:hypothetical protein